MLLIRNGLIHTMETEQAFMGDLLILNGKIERISEHIDPTNTMEVLDVSGLNVYPGFVEAHCHIGISEEKIGEIGDDCNELTNPVTPSLRAIDAINPMDSAFHNALSVGITGVMAGPGSSNPIAGQFAFLKTFGRCVDDMVVLAPAAMKIAFGENPKKEYGDKNMTPSTRMGIAALIRSQLFKAKYYIEKNPGIPETPDFEMESYRPLFEGKIPLKAHAHRTDDIFTAIRIAKEFGLSLTLDHCTEGHMISEEIAKTGFAAIVGPDLASRSKVEVCHADFKTAGILKKAGVTVAITTDHPVSRIQYLPLCAAIAAREGLGEYNALRAITIDAAKICHVDDRVGSLRAGKDADIIIYDGNPLSVSSKLIYTIVNGEIAWPSREQG